MLTKEVRTFIGEHLGYTGPYTDDKDEWQKACRELTAAIAKRLSEGVVWSGEMWAFLYHGGSTLELMVKEEGDFLELIEDGQLVNVTVKIVEGTKGGTGAE